MHDDSYLEDLYDDWHNYTYNISRAQYMNLSEDELMQFLLRKHTNIMLELDQQKRAEKTRLFNQVSKELSRLSHG